MMIQGPDLYETTYILKRGDVDKKEGVAAPGFLQVLDRTPVARGKRTAPASPCPLADRRGCRARGADSPCDGQSALAGTTWAVASSAR